MSGGGSTWSQWTSAGFDPKDIREFQQAKTNYSNDQISQLGAATKGSATGDYRNTNNEDITGLANDFISWKAAQDSSMARYKNYVALANNQPGRDQTILTGPQVSSYSTLLTAQQTAGVPSEFMAKPRLGVPTR